jgi:hypothetical protein
MVASTVIEAARTSNSTADESMTAVGGRESSAAKLMRNRWASNVETSPARVKVTRTAY